MRDYGRTTNFEPDSACEFPERPGRTVNELRVQDFPVGSNGIVLYMSIYLESRICWAVRPIHLRLHLMFRTLL